MFTKAGIFFLYHCFSHTLFWGEIIISNLHVYFMKYDFFKQQDSFILTYIGYLLFSIFHYHVNILLFEAHFLLSFIAYCNHYCFCPFWGGGGGKGGWGYTDYAMEESCKFVNCKILHSFMYDRESKERGEKMAWMA